MKTPLRALDAYHRRSVWTRPLWIAAAGLSLGILLAQLDASASMALLFLATVGALALLARFWPRQTLRETARAVDERTGTRNRFETLVELDGRTDALASAAREEIQAHVRRHPLPLSRLWLAGVLVVAVLLPFNAHWLSFSSDEVISAPRRVALIAETAPGALPVFTPDAAPAGPPPAAALRWLSPPLSITASPTDEILASAEGESITGLAQVTLHVAVNGVARAAIPVAALVSPGIKPLSTSLLLGPLEAKAYAVVTYYLAAERVRPAGVAPEPVWPPLYSPLQFIEIRPAGEPPIGTPDPGSPHLALLQAIRDAKQEQRNLAGETFTLSHDHDELGWSDLMRSASARQAAATRQLGEALPALAAAGFPPEASDRFKEAHAELQRAAGEMAAATPDPALASTLRALAQLTAAETSMARHLWAQRIRETDTAATPEEPSALPAREETPIGRLEALSTRQTALADQLASRSTTEATFVEQKAVARALAALAVEKPFASEINDLLLSASAAAAEAASQLNDQDADAATEPALRAAQTLREALAALDGASRERAADQLLAAQTALNQAATDILTATPEDLAETASDIAKRTDLLESDLRDAATKEQQLGARESAQQLQEMADALQQSQISPETKQLATTAPSLARSEQRRQQDAAKDKLQELSGQAARSSAKVEPKPESIDQTLAELRQLQAKLDRMAGRDPASASGPLRWRSPSREHTAQARDTVALVAEARSETGFAQLTLRVSIDGKPTPPVELPLSVGPGTHSIPIALPLEDLKVKNGDAVSYFLSGTPARGETVAVVSSPVQLILIGTAASPKNPSGAGGEPGAASKSENSAPNGPALRSLREAQQTIADRAPAAENLAKANSDGAAGKEVMQRLKSDQESNRQNVSFAAQTLTRSLSPDQLASLHDARDAMADAEKAWERADPASGTSAAVRALAILAKMEGGGQTSGRAPGEGRGEGDSNTSGGTPRSNSNTAYTSVVDLSQRIEISNSSNKDKVPPPPGPAATGMPLYDYAGALSDRVSGLIKLAEEAQRQARRKETLKTANPAEAPPSYRPAVADYFEKLARERRPSPATSPSR